MSDAAPGRNDPCPCGSGRKYKKCCGKDGAETGTVARRVDTTEVCRTADRLIAAGSLAAAERTLSAALRDAPEDPDLLLRFGRALALHGRASLALPPLRAAAAARPRDLVVLLTLAAAAHADRRLDETGAVLDRAVAAAPDDPRPWTLRAELARDLGDRDGMRDAARRAHALGPEHPAAAALHADIQRRDGHLESALSILDRALRAGSGLPPADVVELQQVRARTLEALERHEDAWAATMAGNRAQAADPGYGAVDRGRATAWIAAYDRHLPPGQGPVAPVEEGPAPLDVLVGFARSGTTMMEQVLAAHPDVVTSDERPIIQRLKRSLGPVADDPDAFARQIAGMSPEGLGRLRARLGEIARAETGSTGRAVRIIHKNPMDSIELPLLDRLVPDARILFAVRDPRDVCLSCVRQRFLPNMTNVHFLDLASTAQLHASVIDAWFRWRGDLRMRWMESRYESVVSDLPGEARAQLEFLGLPWDERVLGFHAAARDRHITTPSAEAVREPVHTRAVGGWRRLPGEIERVEDHLAASLDRWGYPRA